MLLYNSYAVVAACLWPRRMWLLEEEMSGGAKVGFVVSSVLSTLLLVVRSADAFVGAGLATAGGCVSERSASSCAAAFVVCYGISGGLLCVAWRTLYRGSVVLCEMCRSAWQWLQDTGKVKSE